LDTQQYSSAITSKNFAMRARTVKLYKHLKVRTLYMSIPSDIVKDSQFVLEAGQKVKMSYDPKTKALTIQPLTDEE